MTKVYFLDDREAPWFPDPLATDPDGLVAISETLGTERLILAYQKGIFPWLKMGEYPLWHWFSPDPRFLLYPTEFRLSRSLKKAVKDNRFSIRINQNFRQTMKECAQSKRPDQESTWIEDDMIEDYCTLNQLGIAHSIEAYHENKLVGGLYGLFLGQSFFGESMFHHESEASRVALAALVDYSLKHKFDFIDCQVESSHLTSLGARLVDRTAFEGQLENAIDEDMDQVKKIISGNPPNTAHRVPWQNALPESTAHLYRGPSL